MTFLNLSSMLLSFIRIFLSLLHSEYEKISLSDLSDSISTISNHCINFILKSEITVFISEQSFLIFYPSFVMNIMSI